MKENLRWNQNTNKFEEVDSYGASVMEIGGEGVSIHFPKRRKIDIKNNILIWKMKKLRRIMR